MNAADRRVGELLECWMTSVELHARYLALDDGEYAKVQDWPEHQRPTRWVIELARTRLRELQELLAERQAAGDAGFCEALERMAFLANLLGSEHVERFIPLAQTSRAMRDTPPATAPATASPVEPTVETRSLRNAGATKRARRPVPPRSAPAPRTTRTMAAPASPPATPATTRTSPAGSAPTTEPPAVATVIADAVRLMKWGREWPQLAGLITRLANRPAEAEVWRILRKHRGEIEAQARGAQD